MAKKPAKAPTKKVKVPVKTEAPKAKQDFTLTRGDGHKVFTGFEPAKDRITFEYGGNAHIMFDGPVSDDMTFTNIERSATWHVRAIDDDTLITVDADTVRLVGVRPDQLTGWNFKDG